jgi:hypothetical protein
MPSKKLVFILPNIYRQVLLRRSDFRLSKTRQQAYISWVPHPVRLHPSSHFIAGWWHRQSPAFFDGVRLQNALMSNDVYKASEKINK